MTREIKFIRNRIKQLDETLGNPVATAGKGIRNMGAHRIDLVSKCRLVAGRKDITPQGRQDAWLKLMAEYINYINEYKSEALADIKESYDKAGVLSLQASEFSRHRPKNSETWTEFHARSSTLREDIEELAKTSPSKIVEMYAKAEKLEDSIMCFAIEEFGPKAILATQGELGATHPDSRTFGDALMDLNEIIDSSSPERAALQLKALSIQKDLNAAEREINQFHLPTDEIELRKRFNMKSDRLPALLLEAGIGYVDDQYFVEQIDDDILYERGIIRDRLSTELPIAPTSTQSKLEGRVQKLQAKKEAE
jgi:hypothetical protein